MSSRLTGRVLSCLALGGCRVLVGSGVLRRIGLQLRGSALWRPLLPLTGVAVVLLTGTARADLPTWLGSGPAGSKFTVTDSTGLTPTMSYSMNPAGYGRRHWMLMTRTPVGGRVALQFHYQGFHAYFEVTAFIDAVVIHDGKPATTRVIAAGPADCCTTPSEAFDYAGTVGLVLSPGDQYGLEFGGSNFDSNNQLTGMLKIVQRPMLAGNWQTRYGSMRLNQSGGRVTGTYAYCDHGASATISGHLRGRVLAGTWHEPCDPTPSGRFRFVINATGTAFRGTWNYGGAKPKYAWNGHRA